MRYVSIAKARQVLPWANLDIAPGEEFETDKDLTGNPNFARVTTKPARPAKED